MGFYEQIAPYYDYIFPAGEGQLRFIQKAAGLPPKKMLDVACGSGEYSVKLAQLGYEVWASDIDAEMVRLAGQKAIDNKVDVKTFISDMQQLNQHISEQFDCIFCIGNSIVHVGSAEAILSAVLQMKSRLAPGGKLLLQIINFDRVLAKGVTSLPTIYNQEINLEFQRNYIRDDGRGLIYFDTVLTVNKGNEQNRFENRVELFPVKALPLKDILTKAGFSTINLFGGFNREPYIPDESFLLVTEAF
jgi:glycine/sarcosine N-methyltransferase